MKYLYLYQKNYLRNIIQAWKYIHGNTINILTDVNIYDATTSDVNVQAETVMTDVITYAGYSCRNILNVFSSVNDISVTDHNDNVVSIIIYI